MKQLLFFALILLAKTSLAQGGFNAEDTISFARLSFKNPSDKLPYQGEVVAKGKKYGFMAKGTTDKNGALRLNLRNDDTYTFHCGLHTCRPTLTLNPVPYLTYDYGAYTYPHIFLTVSFINPDGQAVAGEPVKVVNKATGELVFVDTTKSDGKISMALPEAVYMVSGGDFDEAYEASPSSRATTECTNINFTFKDIGRRERARRRFEADSLNKVRQVALIAYYDSLAKSKTSIKDLNDTYLPFYLDNQLLLTFFEQKALLYKAEFSSRGGDTLGVFQSYEGQVLPMLFRFCQQKKNLFPVFSCSYASWNAAQDFLLWQHLQAAPNISRIMYYYIDEQGKQKYWLSSKPLNLKTGLALHAEMQAAKISINYLSSNQQTISTLAEAQRQTAKTGENIVFVASTYGDISEKDWAGLSQIKKPIHILVTDIRLNRCVKACCGRMIDLGSNLNPQYLTIAYKTRGSVHTISEDWWDIGNTKENEIKTFLGEKYQLRKGKFYLVKG
jgi:hypothetical protein